MPRFMIETSPRFTTIQVWQRTVGVFSAAETFPAMFTGGVTTSIPGLGTVWFIVVTADSNGVCMIQGGPLHNINITRINGRK